MKALELNSRTNKKGRLKLDIDLKKANKIVKVLILSEEESNWLLNASNNPAFNFLSEPEENIYSIKDGEPI
jgi:hypothetical protein